MSDPIKKCPVYKDTGCAHVDGYLCDYPNCAIMKKYNEELEAEWDPILTPGMTEYAWVRVRGHLLQIKVRNLPSIIFQMDAKAIPQLIKILQRLDKRV